MPDKNDFKVPIRSRSVRPKSKTDLSHKTLSKEKVSRARSVSNNRNKLSDKDQKDIDDLESSFTENLNLKTQLDEYFINKHKKSKISSKSSMSQLGSTQVTSDQALDIMEKMTTSQSDKFIESKMKLIEIEQFPEIYSQICCGFNLIFHGYGSKIKVIEKLRKQYLQSENCMIIPGFNPGVTVNKIFQEIIEQYLPEGHYQVTSKQNSVLAEVIYNYFSKTTNKNNSKIDALYLLIHSLDRKWLINDLRYLNMVAQAKNIVIVASIDHVRSDFYLAKYCNSSLWLYHSLSTYQPYTTELLYSHKMQQTGCSDSNAGMASLRAIMQSLPICTKRLFMILASYQLEHVTRSGAANYEGIPMDVLFRRARDEFLVANELNLRHQLTEFKDHKIVYFKGYGLSEFAKINLEREIVKEFVENFEDFL